MVKLQKPFMVTKITIIGISLTVIARIFVGLFWLKAQYYLPFIQPETSIPALLILLVPSAVTGYGNLIRFNISIRRSKIGESISLSLSALLLGYVLAYLIWMINA